MITYQYKCGFCSENLGVSKTRLENGNLVNTCDNCKMTSIIQSNVECDLCKNIATHYSTKEHYQSSYILIPILRCNDHKGKEYVFEHNSFFKCSKCGKKPFIRDSKLSLVDSKLHVICPACNNEMKFGNMLKCSYKDCSVFANHIQIKKDLFGKKYPICSCDEHLNKKCFIATASYGSILHNDVIILQKFRDLILQKNIIGIFFIKTYEFISPPIATIIDKSNFLKYLVRILVVRPSASFALKFLKKYN